MNRAISYTLLTTGTCHEVLVSPPWALYLLPLLLIGCGEAEPKVRVDVPADIQIPVSVSHEEPEAGTELMVRGRFRVVDDGKLRPVLIHIKRESSQGKFTIHNSGFANSKREKSGEHAYEGKIKTPPKPGQYVVEVIVGTHSVGTHPIKVVGPAP